VRSRVRGEVTNCGMGKLRGSRDEGKAPYNYHIAPGPTELTEKVGRV